jgi:molybdopterin molybdotransferase
MLTVEEALALVEEHAAVMAARRMALKHAAGLVLAEEICSDVNSPPYDKALMDGYAVRSADDQPERRILEEIAAGAVPRFPVTPGAASRIMTGAPIPDGADAVVPVEKSELVDDSTVRLQASDVRPGQNVLPLGASMRGGDVVLRKGALLRPVEIGVLAEIGRGFVNAVPRPRVAILATGNELVPVGETPAQGQIRNSNGPLLAAATIRAGGEAQELGVARDEPEDLRRWIEQGLAADILVLSGGVSAGKFDLIPATLAELGVEQVFHKLALRPGKPLWFGRKLDGDRPVLVYGLPGNPVSSFVCFEVFIRPAIAAMSGRGFASLPQVTARLTGAFEHRGGRSSYLPAVVYEPGSTPSDEQPRAVPMNTSSPVELKVRILPWQGSADLATLTRANGLAYLPAEVQHLAAGDGVRVMLI